MIPVAQDIHAWCVRALREESQRLDAEQQPKGLDSYDEKQVQHVLAKGIANITGWRVLREQLYPTIRRVGARVNQRERCDLVVLPEGSTGPRPAVEAEGDASASLFSATGPGAAGPGTAPADGAFWLEVKVVGQVEYRRGVPVPNRQYTTQLIEALCRDLQKLRDDSEIRSGGVLDVVFCSEAAVAEHDMAVSLGRCMDRGLLAASVMHDEFKVADRVGNRVCSVWLVG